MSASAGGSTSMHNGGDDLSSRLATQNALFTRYEGNEHRANGHYFPDRSLKAIAGENREALQLRKELAAVSTKGFGEQDQLSHELLIRELDQQIKDYDLKLYELPLAEGEGLHRTLAQMADDSFQSVADYDAYLGKLREIPNVLTLSYLV